MFLFAETESAPSRVFSIGRRVLATLFRFVIRVLQTEINIKFRVIILAINNFCLRKTFDRNHEMGIFQTHSSFIYENKTVHALVFANNSLAFPIHLLNVLKSGLLQRKYSHQWVSLLPGWILSSMTIRNICSDEDHKMKRSERAGGSQSQR